MIQVIIRHLSIIFLFSSVHFYFNSSNTLLDEKNINFTYKGEYNVYA